MKFWRLVCKEINEILDLNVGCHPTIEFLSICDKEQWDLTVKELVTNLVSAARLITAKYVKFKHKFQLNDWYEEVQNIAINDKLTCDTEV